ncbi:ATP-binding protein [Streptomyces sp. SL13]|uniref:ATP-binding protein n=1 Tax=Streptantibioticus silvisoli TaxID=2705255 RepID=A0AA90H929_9ACTN|nr:ATP-binding protein [Streptantibioticus silvisoli]MDI5971075.1 ATP-binding protein [Streptantibioticus silvisoli]
MKIQLHADPAAFTDVRRLVALHLSRRGFTDLEFRVTQYLAEMLSNVVKHSGGLTCVVSLSTSSTSVRLVVGDFSPELPVLQQPDWAAESGRGMYLISELADENGAERSGSGKNVWAQFHVEHERAVA